MNKLKFKLNNAELKRDTLAGRDVVVVPTRLQEVGVANSILYPAEILENSVRQWDSCIVTNDHPNSDANKKSNIDGYSIGTVLNCRFEDNFLKADLYLDVERCLTLNCDVIERLENSETVNCSTGIYFIADEESGMYNNSKYNAIAGDMTINHLAVLPKGVAPASAGAELNKNNKQEESKFMKDELKQNETEEEVKEVVETPVAETEEVVEEVVEEIQEVEESSETEEVVEEVVENKAEEVVENKVEEIQEEIVENEQVIIGDEEVYSYIERIGNVEIQRVLKESVNLYINTKKAQIENIIKNSEYTEELLKGKADVELKIIENMLKAKEVETKQDFSGLNLNSAEVKEVSNKMPTIKW